MKKLKKVVGTSGGILILIGLLWLSASAMSEMSETPLPGTNLEREYTPSLTLLEAYEMAVVEARKWQADAMAYRLESIEDEEAFMAWRALGVVRGDQGRRASWNGDFFSPSTQQHLNVLLRNGQVVQTQPFDDLPPQFFLEDYKNLRLDSPYLLKVSQDQYLQPSQGVPLRSGYHFGLSHLGDDRPVIFVRGQDDNGFPAGVRFNAKTGELIDRQHRVTQSGGLFRKQTGQEWTPLTNPAFSEGIFTLVVSSDGAKIPVVLAGTMGGVIWSLDAGETWAVSRQGLPLDESIQAIALAQQFDTDQILFAGTDRGRLFQSKDAGQTWQPIDAGLESDGWPIYAIVPRSDYSETLSLTVGTYGAGIFHSTDGGQTWTIANAGLTNWRVRAMTLVDNRLYAGTDKGLFVSDDEALSFQQIAELKELHVNTMITAEGPEGVKLYVGTVMGLYRSTDEGKNWTKLGDDLRAASESWTVTSLAISPQEPQLLYSGGLQTGVAISSDGGTNWRPMKLPTVNIPNQLPNVLNIVSLSDARQTVLVALEPQSVWEPY